MSIYTITVATITVLFSLYGIFSILRRSLQKEIEQRFELLKKEYINKGQTSSGS